MHVEPASAPCDFPFLSPELPVVWRDDTTLQIGLDPAWARCIPHASRREYTHLIRLDGTRSFDRVIKEFATAGGDSVWFGQVIVELANYGIVTSRRPGAHSGLPVPEVARLAPDQTVWALARPGLNILERRRQAHVHVRGTGRVGVGISTLLTSAGVGTVRVTPFAGDAVHVTPSSIAPLGPSPASLGAPSRVAARDCLHRAAFSPSRPESGHTRQPDLTVLCPPRAIGPSLAQQLSVSPLTHLVAIADGPLVRVGPLVVPGVTPCLHCLDLHRADRDPQWPLVLTQISHARGAQPTATDSVLATLAAATAATHALAFIDDSGAHLPPSGGALLELRVPSLDWRQRRWPIHPDCGCRWTPDPAAPRSNATSAASATQAA